MFFVLDTLATHSTSDSDSNSLHTDQPVNLEPFLDDWPKLLYSAVFDSVLSSFVAMVSALFGGASFRFGMVFEKRGLEKGQSRSEVSFLVTLALFVTSRDFERDDLL